MPATPLDMLGSEPDVLAETRAFNDQLDRLLAGLPSIHTLPPQATRKARETGSGLYPPPVVLPEGRDRSIRGRAGPIPLRVFVPPVVRGAYLHLHGGGWVLGSARLQDPWLWQIAEQANLAVVSVNYRLAPEHPYPAAPDDCEDAALWLMELGPAELGTDVLLIGGESAGAHLSAVTLLRLRDRHGAARAFRAANLVFGSYDLSGTPSQWGAGTRDRILSLRVMQWFATQFVPGLDVPRARDPDVSPLWADLRDLPPALFTVGTRDPLLDDTLFMTARWRAAGNPAELEIYAEGVHGFAGFPLTIARRSRESQIAFLRSRT